MGKIISWAKSNPWEAGGIAFVVGLILLYITGFFGGGSSSSSSGTGEDANEAAFLSAEAAQGEAGDELQAVQDQDQASTAQALINANANQAINQSWATAGTQDDLISSLGAVAGSNGTVLTDTNSNSWNGSNGGSSSGFFGLGAGSNSATWGGSNSTSTQTFIANDEQGQAVGLLGQIEGSEFNAST